MTKIRDIPGLPLEDLRPILQRALGLPEWPGDWPAVGLIFEQCCIRLSRAAHPPHRYEALVIGFGVGRGIAASVDLDPRVAIYRAFIVWKAQRKP